MKTVILASALSLFAAGTQAATITQATSFNQNAAAVAAFEASTGGAPQFSLDFETGFADEDRINGATGVGGLSITGIGQGGGNPKIEGGAGSIGGSNPIGGFALEIADDGNFSGQNVLEFTFTNALAYLSFFVIDAATHTIDYGTGSFVSDNTVASGDSAEFRGIVFSATENVTSVVIPYNGAAGTQGWAIDNITWGYKPTTVPLPASLPLMLSGIAALGLMRGFKRKA